MVPEVEAMPGVIDAGIWIGYVWGDDRRNQGVVMVYGDDKAQVEAGAKKLAQKFWDVRRQFTLEAISDIRSKNVLTSLLPVIRNRSLSVTWGDNPGGGGSGEVTWTLAWVLKRPELQPADGKNYFIAPFPETRWSKLHEKPVWAVMQKVMSVP